MIIQIMICYYCEVRYMFIGREQELRFLEDKYNAPGGQLIVLYGRSAYDVFKTPATVSRIEVSSLRA